MANYLILVNTILLIIFLTKKSPNQDNTKSAYLPQPSTTQTLNSTAEARLARLEAKLDQILNYLDLTQPQDTQNQGGFAIILEQVPSDQKIAAIKEIRIITGLGLKEAKDLVESAPTTIKSGLSLEEADTIARKLEAIGMKVTVT